MLILTGQMRYRQRKTSYNRTYKKLAVQCSADTFVVNQSLVLRINICGKNRQLLIAANRCKFNKRHNGMTQIREPPMVRLDSS